MTKTIQHPDGRVGVEIEGENGSKLVFAPKPADPKTALARRAVAWPGWRWMPGMLDDYGERVVSTDDYPLACGFSRTWSDGLDGVRSQRRSALPDFDDPATLGCLLALVREAWPAAPATTDRHGTWSERNGHHYLWTCSYCTGGDWRQASGATEAEALVAALEAAAKR